MKILIIEDEPFARAELIRLLKDTGRTFEVVGQLDSIEGSVDWLLSHPSPDLIFLDIQLADGLSFDIFRQVSVITPVIFTTAYDEYAIRAFQLNSIDYLLKPINPEALLNSLVKLDKLQIAYTHPESRPQLVLDNTKLDSLLKMISKDYKARILLKVGDQLRSVDMEEVAYFYADEDVVFAMLMDKKRYIVDYTLNQLEAKLDPSKFFRISRGCIAQISSVKKVSKYFNSRLAVELDPPMEEKVLVSRVNVQEFLKWLDR